jgi:hypothetical protein
MPRILKHVDQIAREKNRDVLYVAFDNEIYDGYDYKEWVSRTQLILWLENYQIRYIECSHVASENYMESYRGEIYIDVPYDENNPTYIQVRDYLENPDGSSRIPGLIFYLLPLEIAMRNKHHDEPGFWENWAEKF